MLHQAVNRLFVEKLAVNKIFVKKSFIRAEVKLLALRHSASFDDDQRGVKLNRQQNPPTPLLH